MIIPAIIVTFLVVWYLDYRFGDMYLATTMVGMFALIGVICFLTIPREYVKVEVDGRSTHEVVTLQDGPGSHGAVGGNFLFFSGYQDTDLFYSWYEKLPDGSYRSETVRENWENEIVVYEVDDDSKPRVVEERIRQYYGSPGWAVPFGWDLQSDYYYTRWELYVPKGTITRDLSLDAK